MSKENKSMFVVLGILSIGPMSGYDIKGWIKSGVGYFWKISYNQIYPALEKFVAEELATYVTDKKGSRPERKVYSITEKGLEVLKKWLLEPMDYRSPNGNEFLLKLFFGSMIPVEETLKRIMEYREYLCKRLVELQAVENRMSHQTPPDKTLPFRHAALDHGLTHIGSTIKWCDRTLAFFKNQNKTD